MKERREVVDALEALGNEPAGTGTMCLRFGEGGGFSDLFLD